MHKHIVHILLAALLGSALSVESKIVETKNFSEIVSHVTPGALVILDIDDTLLVPVQMLGCDEWFKEQLKKHQKEGLSASQALEKSLAEWEGIRNLTKMEVVEPGTEEIIQELQREGHCIIGLTTQRLALALRTYHQLQIQDIDLSVTAPSKKDHYFHSNGHGILYRQGILFTAGTSKGEALFKLCEDMGYTPERVVFINDKETHLVDIEIEAEKRGVEFIGLRYAFSDERKASFRPEIADFQFTHSTLKHLLSDEEAHAMMKGEL